MDYAHAEKILSVSDLVIKFNLRGRVLTAIRGISMDIYKGESLAIVGESGSGKSVFTKSFMGLLDSNGWIDNGSIMYGGVDLAKYTTEKQWLRVRGREIAMVFQDPITSLNPLKTIGRQIQETVELHQGLRGAAAREKTHEILRDVGIAEPERRAKQPCRPAAAGPDSARDPLPPALCAPACCRIRGHRPTRCRGSPASRVKNSRRR